MKVKYMMTDQHMEEIKRLEELLLNDEEGYQRCAECDRVFEHHTICDALTEVNNGEEKEHVCEDCINELYSKCTSCGEYFPREDMRDVGDGDYACETCYDHDEQFEDMRKEDAEGEAIDRAYEEERDRRMMEGLE